MNAVVIKGGILRVQRQAIAAPAWAPVLVALAIGAAGWLPAAQAQAPSPAQAPAIKEAPSATEDPELEKRVQRIAVELRCLVCQNQTIADSHAELAVDLRRQVREMLRRGSSERQVLDYMTARYGDFVLYRPPVKGTTALLWAGPGALLLGGLAVLVLVLRRRSRLPDAAFEPDVPEEDHAATSTQPSAAGAAPMDPRQP